VTTQLQLSIIIIIIIIKFSSFEFTVHQTDMYEGEGKGLHIPKMYLSKTVPRDLNGGSLCVLERIFIPCAK